MIFLNLFRNENGIMLDQSYATKLREEIDSEIFI